MLSPDEFKDFDLEVIPNNDCANYDSVLVNSDREVLAELGRQVLLRWLDLLEETMLVIKIQNTERS